MNIFINISKLLALFARYFLMRPNPDHVSVYAFNESNENKISMFLKRLDFKSNLNEVLDFKYYLLFAHLLSDYIRSKN